MEALKIFSFSDIHVDINSFLVKGGKSTFLNEFKSFLSKLKDINVVLCNGDVSPHLNELEELLNVVSESVDADHFIFVPGNHDIWQLDSKVEDGISREKYEDLIPKTVSNTKFHYLPNNPLIIDDSVAFFGSIGWYDYSFRNPKWDDYLKEQNTWYYAKVLKDVGIWNDGVYAEWGMHDLDVVKYCIDDLTKDYKQIKDISTKIACFHHVPFLDGVKFKDQLNWDYFSAFMGSKFIGDKLLEWNTNLVFYGHTHFPHEYKKMNCQAYCSPIGYQNEWETKNLQEVFSTRSKIVEYRSNI